MNSSEKILKLISNFIETGVLTSQDAKKELVNNLKFKRDNLIDKLLPIPVDAPVIIAIGLFINNQQ